MNEVQRYNLQRGIKEDRRFEHTTYISDGSMLDNYLLHIARLNEMVRENEENKRQEKEIEEQVEKALAKVLDKLLK